MTRAVENLLSLLLATVAMFGLASAAIAQVPLAIDEKVGSTQGWAIGYSRALQGCLARATYTDGTSVWVGFGTKLQFYIAFTNPAWQSVEVGKSYQIRIDARGQGTWRGAFVGFEGEGTRGIINAGLKKEFLLDLAATSGISVKLADKPIARVSMAGSRAALVDVLACQRDRPNPSQSEARAAPGPAAPAESRASSGTGFFVSHDGHVITNAHVVDGCKTLSVIPVGGVAEEVKLLATDKRNDLALIKTSLKPATVPPLRTKARVGESIAVFGFPLAGLLATSGNFTLGNITANAGLNDDTSQFQISAPVQPGNSGGPLVDQNGNVIGVIVAKLNALSVAQATKDVPQNVNFAIKAATVANFLESNGVTPKAGESAKALGNADIADLVKTFTVRITCK